MSKVVVVVTSTSVAVALLLPPYQDAGWPPPWI